MRKKEFTEAEIRTQFITLEPFRASWDESQIREELYLTRGWNG